MIVQHLICWSAIMALLNLECRWRQPGSRLISPALPSRPGGRCLPITVVRKGSDTSSRNKWNWTPSRKGWLMIASSCLLLRDSKPMSTGGRRVLRLSFCHRGRLQVSHRHLGWFELLLRRRSLGSLSSGCLFLIPEIISNRSHSSLADRMHLSSRAGHRQCSPEWFPLAIPTAPSVGSGGIGRSPLTAALRR